MKSRMSFFIAIIVALTCFSNCFAAIPEGNWHKTDGVITNDLKIYFNHPEEMDGNLFYGEFSDSAGSECWYYKFGKPVMSGNTASMTAYLYVDYYDDEDGLFSADNAVECTVTYSEDHKEISFRVSGGEDNVFTRSDFLSDAPMNKEIGADLNYEPAGVEEVAHDDSEIGNNIEERKYADSASVSRAATEEKNSLVYWIIGVAVLLLILQVYINFSDEFDAWYIVLILTTILSILSSIVGYRIMILHYLPEQMNPGPEDGAMGYLKMVAGLAIVAISYFWSFKTISKGLVEDGVYVPLGCFKSALALLVVSALFGMSSDFTIFLDISNDFIPSISFQNGVVNGIVSVLMALILVLTIIQIVKFFKNLPAVPAIIATVLLPVLMAGGIAMCLSCIPLLIISVVALVVFGMFMGASEAQSHPSPEMIEEEMRRDFINSTPDRIQISEGVCTIDLHHTGCGIYRSSDGRKFEKTGDSVVEKFD